MSHVQHILRIASTIACGIVIAAFVFWASDEGRADSNSQVARVAQSDGPATAAAPGTPVAAPADQKHHGVRGTIESANAELVAPFDGIGKNGGPWAAHGIPALIALLTYGLLARVLIPYLGDERR